MYNDIINFLDHKRLNEAFTQLTAFIELLENWKLKSELTPIKDTYRFMLQYAEQGMSDPSRESMYESLLRKGYELADKANILSKSRNSNSEYNRSIRLENDLLNVSYDSITQQLELSDINQQNKNYKEGKISKEEYREIHKKHEEGIDLLFLKAWSSFHWTEQEYSEARLLIGSVFLTANDIALFVSGVTLGLMKMFDEKKIMLLFDAYNSRKENIINQRALIGILLSVYMHEKRIALYPQVKAALQIMKDNPKCISQIYDIQILLLLSRETEKIDKKMREEIIPQMMKNSKLMDPNFKIENLEELDELNPEWKKGADKFSEKVKELGELQLEGADTYMSTFSQLKSYPFFKKAAHWFTPFYNENSAIADFFDDNSFKQYSLMNLLMNTTTFCNSDKYSFCLSVQSMKGMGLEYLTTEMEQAEETLNNKYAGIKPELNEPLDMSRQYIQDLYRFYKLWNYRNEMTDIFRSKLSLRECQLLHPLIINDKTGKQIADYLFAKEYMDEAVVIYESIKAKGNADADIMQKIGFAYQKQSQFEKAIDAYLQADLLKADHLWTMKQLAKCYKKTGEYSEALKYLHRIKEIQPENLNTLLQIGQCLAITGKYNEAIKYFYKVEYLGKAPENAQRPIGWCYFMTSQYDKAIDIYQKIIQNTTPTATDWLNLGHVYQVKGKIADAVKCYRKVSEKCKTHDDFLSMYLADKKALIEHGVKENDIHILADAI